METNESLLQHENELYSFYLKSIENRLYDNNHTDAKNLVDECLKTINLRRNKCEYLHTNISNIIFDVVDKFKVDEIKLLTHLLNFKQIETNSYLRSDSWPNRENLKYIEFYDYFISLIQDSLTRNDDSMLMISGNIYKKVT